MNEDRVQDIARWARANPLPSAVIALTALAILIVILVRVVMMVTGVDPSAEDQFVEKVRGHYTMNGDTTDAELIDAGRSICSDLDRGNTVPEEISTIAEIPALTDYDAGYFVGLSVGTFCRDEHGSEVEDL